MFPLRGPHREDAGSGIGGFYMCPPLKYKLPKNTLRPGIFSSPPCLHPQGERFMSDKDEILFDHNNDGIDRRGFLKCMAWAGTGALCIVQGGVLKSYGLSRLAELPAGAARGELSFVQISDSHMGFSK